MQPEVDIIAENEVKEESGPISNEKDSRDLKEDPTVDDNSIAGRDLYIWMFLIWCHQSMCKLLV